MIIGPLADPRASLPTQLLIIRYGTPFSRQKNAVYNGLNRIYLSITCLTMRESNDLFNWHWSFCAARWPHAETRYVFAFWPRGCRLPRPPGPHRASPRGDTCRWSSTTGGVLNVACLGPGRRAVGAGEGPLVAEGTPVAAAGEGSID